MHSRNVCPKPAILELKSNIHVRVRPFKPYQTCNLWLIITYTDNLCSCFLGYLQPLIIGKTCWTPICLADGETDIILELPTWRMRGARRKEDCVHLSCNLMLFIQCRVLFSHMNSLRAEKSFVKRKAGWGEHCGKVAQTKYVTFCSGMEHSQDMLWLKSPQISLTHRRTWRGSRSKQSKHLASAGDANSCWTWPMHRWFHEEVPNNCQCFKISMVSK